MGTMRKYLEFQYEEIELLSAKKNIHLVKDRISSQIFVKRELPLSMVEIYGKLKRVCHQNLVRIVEVYTLLDACIVIEEYINGMSLEQLFNMKGMFPEDVSVLYFRALLEALKALHDVELVHRDVNMSNIRITTDGVLKLMGFAAVRKVRGDGNVDTVLMGTDGTAAPEQFGFSESDARADVYAAGVLLNQMLTGSFPILRRYIGTKKIEEIIDKCIQIDKHKRYDRVEQIIQTLDQISGPNVQKLYSMLPGLRVEKWYGRLAVCCGYEFFLYYFFSFLEHAIHNIHEWRERILFIVAVIVLLCVPAALISNFAQYDIRILKMYNVSHWERVLLRVAFGVCAFLIGGLIFRDFL